MTRSAAVQDGRATVQTLVLQDFPPRLPLPNGKVLDTARALSPNGRAHWAHKRKARLAIVDHVTIRALTQNLRHMHGFVTLSATFVYPVHRTRDDDNLATGVLKAVRDVLVRGGWLEADDMDHLQQMPPEVRVEKGQRRLELRFEERRGL